jgi:hypothetical protein
VMVASRPKISFWSDGSTSPWNYGWFFAYLKKKKKKKPFRKLC